MIRTREDVALLLLDWVRPLKAHYSVGGAQLKIGHTSAHYGEASGLMEGYARVLWGLAPLFARENKELPTSARQEIEDWKVLTRTGLIHGTDPSHGEYWQDVKDYDQKMVEMASIVNAIMLAPKVFWEPLTATQKENVYNWLNQINCHQVHPNNWRFFRILVNTLFRCLDLSANETCLKDDFAVIESCYEGDGWYYDGHPGQKDYYIPFAMHYYGLLIAKWMEESDPVYSQTLKERASRFYPDFIHWFNGEGREVPYGRSLTYRFAHSACFSAMAYAGVDVPMGEIKHLVLGNLRYWSENPVFDNGGVLTIGYQYPNLFMSERYNAPGSPYWGFKTFLILALPKEHLFWQEEEKEPVLENKRVLLHPNMIAVQESGGHALLYPTGQRSANFGCTVEKYQKFVYSNYYGFSVSRGTQLEDGAFDNTLAVTAAGENFWRMRREIQRYEVTEDTVRTLCELMPGVTVESLVVPCEQGHLRVHFVRTEIEAELADGGFAIPAENGRERMEDSMVLMDDSQIYLDCPWDKAAAVNLEGGGTAKLVRAFPNTSLMYPLTVIPTIYYRLKPGQYCLVDYFYAGKDSFDNLAPIPQYEYQKCRKWS